MTGCLFVQVASETAAVTLMELCTCEKFETQQVCNGQVGTSMVKMGSPVLSKQISRSTWSPVTAQIDAYTTIMY